MHFVVMNFEKDFGPGSPQFEFVSRDLANSVDRARTPWVRVCFRVCLCVYVCSIVGAYPSTCIHTKPTKQVVLIGHRPMYVLSYWDDGPANPMSDSDQTVARLLQVRALVDRSHFGGYNGISTLKSPPSQSPCAQASLEDLLVAHRVDMALYGHHHSYQRTCQVRIYGL